MTETITSGPAHRALWVVILFLAMSWVGLCVGMGIGARFFVPAGSGLAGPAIAFGYGMLGGAAGAITAGLLAVMASGTVVRTAATIALAPAILLIGFVAYRVATLPPPVGAEGDGLRPRTLTTPATP